MADLRFDWWGDVAFEKAGTSAARESSQKTVSRQREEVVEGDQTRNIQDFLRAQRGLHCLAQAPYYFRLILARACTFWHILIPRNMFESAEWPHHPPKVFFLWERSAMKSLG